MSFAMRRMFQALHRRNLTSSAVALFFAFVALAFLPEHSYRLQQHGTAYLVQAGTVALAGLIVCTLALVVLLKDKRGGYPTMRCSLAALLWALACFPVVFLTVVVVGGLLR